MAVVFDSSILIDLFDPRLESHRKAKLDYLVETLQKERTKILIPSPSLTELMVKADKARDEYLENLTSKVVFKIVTWLDYPGHTTSNEVIENNPR